MAYGFRNYACKEFVPGKFERRCVEKSCYVPLKNWQFSIVNNKLVQSSQEMGKEAPFRIRFFIVHKEANFDLWDQSIHVFLICVSFLLSTTLKLSLPLSMSHILNELYYMLSMWRANDIHPLPCLHCIHYMPSNSLHFDTKMQIPNLWDRVRSSVRALRALLHTQHSGLTFAM